MPSARFCTEFALDLAVWSDGAVHGRLLLSQTVGILEVCVEIEADNDLRV